MNFTIEIILLHLSAFLSLTLFISLLKSKNKKQIHYSFMMTILMLFIWNLGYIAEIYIRNITGKTEMLIVKFWFFGLIFIPIFFLLTSIIYLKTKISIKKYFFLFIIPITSYVLLLTNEYHHLFFIRFTITNEYICCGSYFLIHTLYSYTCVIIGAIIFSYSAIKNSSIFSMQSTLIVIGSLLPVILNIVIMLKLIYVPLYTTAVAFSFLLILFYIAIFKLNILNIPPIALQKVVDKISDAFIVLNEDLVVVDFNKPMLSIFSEITTIKHNLHLSVVYPSKYEEIKNIIEIVKIEKQSYFIEKHIQENNFNKYFQIEITPLYSSHAYIGIVVLFKDITKVVEYVNIIKQNQRVLIEQEKYAIMGYLVGGIAHNLKTPIMSIAGKTEAINALSKEIKNSIEVLDKNDYLEISSEMEQHISKINFYCSYMNDIITTVQGQITHNQDKYNFSIEELIKSVEGLITQEIKKNKCSLKILCQIDPKYLIHGNITNMIQVINNIILNSIHAYASSSGIIELNISMDDKNLIISVIDFGIGIPESVKNKLFSEMITTKGSKGTGLGLYISNTIIVGKFNGTINIESTEGVGTTVNILIPKLA